MNRENLHTPKMVYVSAAVSHNTQKNGVFGTKLVQNCNDVKTKKEITI